MDLTNQAFSWLPPIFGQQNLQQSLLNMNGDQSIGNMSSLAVGFGNTAMYTDRQGIFLGNTKFASAPFSVDMNGALVASGATISGTITATSGTIGGWNIGATTLSNNNTTLDSGGSVRVGTGNDIAILNALDANYRIWVGNATPASAPFSVKKNGDVLCNNLTATGSIVSSASNDRIFFDNSDNSLKIYNGGVVRGQMRGASSGLGFVAEVGSYITRRDEGFYSSSSTTTFTDFSKFYSANLSPFGLITVVEMLANNKFGVFGSGQTGPYLTVSAAAVGLLANKVTLKDDTNIEGIDVLKGFNDVRIQTNKTGSDVDNSVKILDGNGTELMSLKPIGATTSRLDMNGHSLTLGSDKTAIVPVAGEFRALYAVESPDVWFCDFCDNKDSISKLFLDVTEGDMRFIKADKGYQVWRRRKGHANKRFEKKSYLQFIKNEAFLSMAK
jgi:hypothetical protein